MQLSRPPWSVGGVHRSSFHDEKNDFRFPHLEMRRAAPVLLWVALCVLAELHTCDALVCTTTSDCPSGSFCKGSTCCRQDLATCTACSEMGYCSACTAPYVLTHTYPNECAPPPSSCSLPGDCSTGNCVSGACCQQNASVCRTCSLSYGFCVDCIAPYVFGGSSVGCVLPVLTGACDYTGDVCASRICGRGACCANNSYWGSGYGCLACDAGSGVCAQCADGYAMFEGVCMGPEGARFELNESCVSGLCNSLSGSCCATSDGATCLSPTPTVSRVASDSPSGTRTPGGTPTSSYSQVIMVGAAGAAEEGSGLLGIQDSATLARGLVALAAVVVATGLYCRVRPLGVSQSCTTDGGEKGKLDTATAGASAGPQARLGSVAASLAPMPPGFFPGAVCVRMNSVPSTEGIFVWGYPCAVFPSDCPPALAAAVADSDAMRQAYAQAIGRVNDAAAAAGITFLAIYAAQRKFLAFTALLAVVGLIGLIGAIHRGCQPARLCQRGVVHLTWRLQVQQRGG